MFVHVYIACVLPTSLGIFSGSITGYLSVHSAIPSSLYWNHSSRCSPILIDAYVLAGRVFLPAFSWCSLFYCSWRCHYRGRVLILIPRQVFVRI
ncbi:hypothetical protein BGX38DRAFT_1178932 [Terfezia claveryi]|nr:hypothetical protein BGX38DRAFT_1178932 [Terfezia claveryi]